MVELSPLDQILKAEARVARRIAAAQATAEEVLAMVPAQAEELKRQARQAGHREGQILVQQAIAKAEKEACELITQSHDQAESLYREGNRHREAAVQFALAMVTGRTVESVDS